MIQVKSLSERLLKDQIEILLAEQPTAITAAELSNHAKLPDEKDAFDTLKDRYDLLLTQLIFKDQDCLAFLDQLLFDLDYVKQIDLASLVQNFKRYLIYDSSSELKEIVDETIRHLARN